MTTTMVRTPSDATRFTATGPYASDGSTFTPSASPSSSGSQITFRTAVPENETPQQKIARLRAAAAASRRIPESQFDKVVRIGRAFADRAHRFTALGLIGLTVISAMVATAGVTDMLLHNRRRRNEWLAAQQAKTKSDLKEALAARERGLATDDQMLLINRERAAAEAADARRNRPGIFRRAKNWAFGGATEEQQRASGLGEGAATADPLTVPHIVERELQDDRRGEGVYAAMEQRLEQKRERARETMGEAVNPQGGPLDQEAQRFANAAQSLSASWTSWLAGKK